MNRLTVLSLSIFTILGVLLVGYAFYAYSRIFWCTTIKISSFSQTGSNTYIDDALQKDESESLQDLVNQAKMRITNKFGAMQAAPVIIIVDTEKNHRKYGLGTDRQSVRAYITPWEKYLVISSGIRDIDLLAHEFLHVELAERLGYLNYKTKLPVWLDEGLALQVDDRKRFQVDTISFDRSEIDRIKTLDRSAFFIGDNDMYTRNMRAAKIAVRDLLKQHDLSIDDLLTEVIE